MLDILLTGYQHITKKPCANVRKGRQVIVLMIIAGRHSGLEIDTLSQWSIIREID